MDFLTLYDLRFAMPYRLGIDNMQVRYEAQSDCQHSAQVTPLQPPSSVLSACENDSCGQSCVPWSAPDRKMLLVQIHRALRAPFESSCTKCCLHETRLRWRPHLCLEVCFLE